MALQPRPAICERARSWASLRLDAELSEFEEALLSAHLRRCATCRDYEASVSGAVLALREAPLEQLEHAVAVPSRHHAHRAFRPAVVARAAAVVVATVGIATALATQSATHFPSAHPATEPTSDNGDLVQGRALRIAQLGAAPSHTISQLGFRGPVFQSPGHT